jgi:hypothetical protein
LMLLKSDMMGGRKSVMAALCEGICRGTSGETGVPCVKEKRLLREEERMDGE